MVEIKNAEPKEPSNHLVAPTYGSNIRNLSCGDGYACYGAFDGGYGAYNNYKMSGDVASRLGYGCYGSGRQYDRIYGSLGSSSLGAYGYLLADLDPVVQDRDGNGLDLDRVQMVPDLDSFS